MDRSREQFRVRGPMHGRAPSFVAAGIALAVVFALVAPLPVHGCSCVEIEYWGFLGPQNVSLPANAAGVLWFEPFDRHRPQLPASESSVAGRITVEKRLQDRFETVPAAARSVRGFRGIFVVAPREGLVVGATYRFTDRGSSLTDKDPRWAKSRQGGRGPYRQVLLTVDADEFPASAQLTLEKRDAPEQPLRIAEGNLCGMSARHQALAPVATYLPPDAQKWQDSLLFRTLVDGEPWAGAGSSCSVIPSGRTWRPLGQEIVYGTCPDPDVRPGVPLGFRGPGGPARLLTPAKHTVQMEAYLPGTDIVLKSRTLVVDLTCPVPMER
ncbi:MAG: hypothetical protein OXG74_02755 [Acidobacteria bacterium]|nr:hypothetical protein [Acidobacteriota bacterium]